MIRIHPEIAQALAERRPVVALETTLVTHGLPRPLNLETALAAEEAVRDVGALPATVGAIDGELIVGLGREQIRHLAELPSVAKASRRDLAIIVAKRRSAGTTVAATMFLAHQAGIAVMATGGIGGVHRGAEHSFDISADLLELSRTPVAVVCAGAKSVLDIPKTLELLETLGVAVIGFRTSTFPAFYVPSSGLPVQARFDEPRHVAEYLQQHWALEGRGVLIAQPVEEEIALSAAEFEAAMCDAEGETEVRGSEVTPVLLSRLANLTSGRTLDANRELIVANARLASEIAMARCDISKSS